MTFHLPLLPWLVATSLLAVLFLNRLKPQLLPIGLLLFAALTVLSAAQRVQAPEKDISYLARNGLRRLGPVDSYALHVIGRVAGSPRLGDFGIEFPLKIEPLTVRGQTYAGNIWVRLPRPPANRIVDMPRAGDVLRLRGQLLDLPRAGNFGQREQHWRYIGANCWSIVKVGRNDTWQIVRRDVRSLSARIEGWQRAVGERQKTVFFRAHRAYAGTMSQLLGAMVWGEGSLVEPLPKLTRDRYRAAGLSHILVASGSQVSFLALLLIMAARGIGFRRWSWVLVLPVLLLYALITGGASSIWRATIGGVCVAWALSQGRDVDGLSLWSLALLALFIIEPMQLLDIGFQLTFAATFGLLVFAPTLQQGIERAVAPGGITQLAALSLGAQLATLPLLLYHFGRFSAAAIVTNFLAVPLAGLLVGFGLMGLVLPLGSVTYALTQGIDKVATFGAGLPGAQYEGQPLGLYGVWGLYVLVVVLLAALNRSGTGDSAWFDYVVSYVWKRLRLLLQAWRPQSTLALLMLVACVYVGWLVFSQKNRTLRVTLLDVGQGESIVIQAPSGRTVLIDGGTSPDEGRGDVGRSVIVPFLQAQGVKKIDAMILTHADADHCNGLAEVTREVPVGLALDGAAPHLPANAAPPAEYDKVRKTWQQEQVTTRVAQSGQVLNLGNGITLTLLWPLPHYSVGTENNNCVVARLDYGATSMLLTGDLEKEGEEALLRSGADLHCNVLKVGHHGSNTSSSEAFLQAVNPEAAVLSCGRYNTYRHPGQEAMNRLARAKISVYRTYLDGEIDVQLDGKTCHIQTFR